MTTTRFTARAGAILLAILPSLAPAPGQAQVEPAGVSQPAAPALKGLAVSFDLYGLRRLDRAHRAWGNDKAWSASGLEVGYDVFRLGEELRLALAVGWMREGQGERLPGEGQSVPGTGSLFDGELATSSLYAAGTLRWRASQLLQPYLGLALGGTRSEVKLGLGAGPQYGLRSTAHGLLGRASLGVRLQPRALTVKRANRAPLLGLALGLEVGALVGTPLEHGSASVSGSDAINAPSSAPIPVQPVPLGDLSPNGGYLRLAAVIVF